MSKSRKSGLPKNIVMKHDDHYVDFISTRSAGPKIRMIGLKKINLNPNTSRYETDGLGSLVISIKEKGVLFPILVRPMNGRYEIIAGNRRYIASKMAQLSNIPCIVMNVKDHEAMEISLIENLQRKDLDVFEEADGLKALKENFGYDYQKIAYKMGKERLTVKEMLYLSRIPKEIRELCKKFKITNKKKLIEIAEEVIKHAKN